MKKIRLGDIATLITKGTTPTTIGFSFVDTGVNFVKIESISENGEFLSDKFAHITDECDNKLKRSQLEENDILFSIAGAIGRTAIVPRSILPANTNQALAIIRIPQNAINLRFVLYALQSQAVEEQSEKQKQGVAQLNLSLKNIADILIPLVSSEKQDEIVRNLAAVDTAIAIRKEQIRLIDQVVKSRFIELFGMPGTDAFGWGLVPLGSTCNINPKKSLDSRLVSGAMVSFVPMPAVTEHGEIDATAIKEYDEVKTGFTYFAENDVLFAKITPCMENGKGAVAKGLHNGIGFGSTEFHVLRPISGKTDPYWIYTLTAFSQFRMDAASNMTGSAGQRRVPASFLENYRVSLPPIALQEQFAAFVEQTDKSKYYSSLSFRYCQAAANTYRQEWMTCRTSDF
jgi:type I restriction enzyme S subunit